MRLLKFTERSFVSRTIYETRLLVNSSHALHIKIALIESAIADETERIAAFERQMEGASSARLARLQKIVDLRRRALGHYRSTEKALLAQQERPWIFRPLALIEVGLDGQPSSEYPFMEFSS